MEPNKRFRFPTQDAKRLFDPGIHDLPTLRQRLAGTVLVAFDTEGVSQHYLGCMYPRGGVSELGVAVLRSSHPNMRRGLYHFYEDNDIETFTIRIHERNHGPVVGVMTEKTEEEAGPRLQQFFSSKIDGERILIGFNMRAKWT
jgi:hypothetical protein